MDLTRVIERRVLGLSLIDKMRNKKIRIITRVFNFLDKLAHLKWQLEGHQLDRPRVGGYIEFYCGDPEKRSAWADPRRDSWMTSDKHPVNAGINWNKTDSFGNKKKRLTSSSVLTKATKKKKKKLLAFKSSIPPQTDVKMDENISPKSSLIQKSFFLTCLKKYQNRKKGLSISSKQTEI